MLEATCARPMQWLAVRKYGAGNFSVSSSVPVQTKARPASMKLMSAIDFLRTAMAASSAASPVLHLVSTVHAAAALASSGRSKCTTPPSRTADVAGRTAANTSTSCALAFRPRAPGLRRAGGDGHRLHASAGPAHARLERARPRRARAAREARAPPRRRRRSARRSRRAPRATSSARSPSARGGPCLPAPARPRAPARISREAPASGTSHRRARPGSARPAHPLHGVRGPASTATRRREAPGPRARPPSAVRASCPARQALEAQPLLAPEAVAVVAPVRAGRGCRWRETRAPGSPCRTGGPTRGTARRSCSPRRGPRARCRWRGGRGGSAG